MVWTIPDARTLPRKGFARDPCFEGCGKLEQVCLEDVIRQKGRFILLLHIYCTNTHNTHTHTVAHTNTPPTRAKFHVPPRLHNLHKVVALVAVLGEILTGDDDGFENRAADDFGLRLHVPRVGNVGGLFRFKPDPFILVELLDANLLTEVVPGVLHTQLVWGVYVGFRNGEVDEGAGGCLPYL